MTAPLRQHISTLALESITGPKDLLDWAILVENQTENLCFVPSPLLLSLIYLGLQLWAALFRVSEFSLKRKLHGGSLLSFYFKRGFIYLSIPCLPNSPEFNLRVQLYKILEFYMLEVRGSVPFTGDG